MASVTAAKALLPSARGMSRSAPVVTGRAAGAGSALETTRASGVRPGAQEATSSARRRRGNRRRAEPYTSGHYHGFVYLSTLRLGRVAGSLNLGGYNSAAFRP